MGLKLNKPYLRAAMEADCQKIVRGQVLRSDVVAACLKEMKTRFLQAVSQASKLDDAVSKVAGTPLSFHLYSSFYSFIYSYSYSYSFIYSYSFSFRSFLLFIFRLLPLYLFCAFFAPPLYHISLAVISNM